MLLRKIAAVRGLVTDQVRARVWPRLLGAAPVPAERYTRHALERHRDSSTVQCDVDRSLWHFTADWSEDRRASKRAALQRLINGAATAECPFGRPRRVARSTRVRSRRAGVVGMHASSVYYYQARCTVLRRTHRCRR